MEIDPLFLKAVRDGKTVVIFVPIGTEVIPEGMPVNVTVIQGEPAPPKTWTREDVKAHDSRGPRPEFRDQWETRPIVLSDQPWPLAPEPGKVSIALRDERFDTLLDL